jgi:alpha-L-arabinofuranosidase
MGGTAYAKLVNHWAPAIRAAAPNSQIIACGQKRDPDLAFSKQVITGAGANFQILGVHNYEYTESAYFTGVRRIGSYLRELRDFIHQSAHPDIKIGVLEWGMSVGKSSMDWRSGIHAAGNLMLYESMSEDITMTCPAVFMRQKGYVRWGYGASLMFNHTTSWPSGGYAVGKLFREHYQPVRLAYLEGDVDAIATRSTDGKVVVVKAVNYTARPAKLDLRLAGTEIAADATVRIREIAAPLTAECTADQPALFEPRERSAKNSSGLVHELAPHSVVVLEFRNSP